MKPYLNLAIGAPARLAALRAKSVDWKAARTCGYHNYHSYCGDLSGARGANGVMFWSNHVGGYFRGEVFVDKCDEAPRDIRRHRGWYTDTTECHETMRGIVGRLPHGRFVAGYYNNGNGERVYFDEVFDDIEDAILSADDHARMDAEIEAEHSDKSRAAYTLRDRIEDSLKRLRECITLRHNSCFEYARDEITELVQSIRDDRETLTTQFADYCD